MIYRAVFVALMLPLSGCVYKGYAGAVKPDSELAVVKLKTPTTALIPLFWIPPFNMLNWFAEDWFQTATSPPISIRGAPNYPEVPSPDLKTDSVYTLTQNRFSDALSLDLPTDSKSTLTLNRFNAVKVVPKEYFLTSARTQELDRVATGSATCSSTRVSCSCPNKADQKNNKQCYRDDQTCSTPYRVTAHDRACETRFITKPGVTYEVFVRDDVIQVKAIDSAESAIAGGCSWGPEYQYDTTSTSFTQGSCC